MGVHFLDLAKHLAALSLAGYAVFLVLSLTALGALTESRRSGFGLELTRLLVTAAIPLLTGGWFGVPHVEPAVTGLFLAIAAVSALALGWLALSAHGEAGSGKPIPG
jgi:alkylglycerol monooxygenase